MSDNDPKAFPAQQQTPPGLTDEMRPVPDHGEESYVGHGRLEGQVALVTGGDSGIGRAVAIAYAREGADVAFTYLPEEQPDADATTALVEAAGRRALPIAVDLRASAACDETVRRTVDELGGLDVLVNNAGYQMARDHAVDAETPRTDGACCAPRCTHAGGVAVPRQASGLPSVLRLAIARTSRRSRRRQPSAEPLSDERIDRPLKTNV